MSLLKLLNLQGIIGIVAALVLGAGLGRTVYMADHWHDQAVSFESQFHGEQAAHRQTVINYQTAAEQARKADAANKARAEREQAAINTEREQSYEARIADARARADRVHQPAASSGHPGSPGAAPVPGVPDAAGGPDAAAPQDRLPDPDDRLIATEQAIQLDELIRWNKSQARIDLQGNSQSSPSGNH